MRIASRRLNRDQDGVSGFYAHPAGAARKPGVLVLHHANGVTADFKSTVVELAYLGVAALVPNLYHMLAGMRWPLATDVLYRSLVEPPLA